jgi:hypothetical protein
VLVTGPSLAPLPRAMWVEWLVELRPRVPHVSDATEDAGKDHNSLRQISIKGIKKIPSLFMLV